VGGAACLHALVQHWEHHQKELQRTRRTHASTRIFSQRIASAVDHPEEREARLTTPNLYCTAQQQEERTLGNQWLTVGVFITNAFSTRG